MTLRSLSKDRQTGEMKDALCFPASQMYKRYLDNVLLERQRKCTMFSKPITLLLEDKSGKSRLLNVMDTPGHPDFIDEAIAAMEITDGAVFVLDVVEGLTLEGKQILREVISRQMGLVLVFNKLDRMIVEMRIPPRDAYLKLKLLLDEVNGFIQKENPELFAKRDLNPAYYKSTEDIQPRKGYKVRPARPNVLFASCKYGLLFSLETFSEIYLKEYAEKMGRPTPAKFLWGDIYFDEKSQSFSKKGKEGGQRTFVQFVLEPLYKIFAHCVAKEDHQLREFCLKLGLILPKKNLFDMELKKVLRRICSECLLKTSDFVEVVLSNVGDVAQGNARILENIKVSGDLQKAESGENGSEKQKKTNGSNGESSIGTGHKQRGGSSVGTEQNEDRLLIYFTKIYPEVPDNGDVPQEFSIFGRILSGSIDLKTIGQRSLVLVTEGYQIENLAFRDKDFEVRDSISNFGEEKFQVGIDSLYLSNTNFKISLNRAFSGNLIMLPGLGKVLPKSGYLFESRVVGELRERDLGKDQIALKLPQFGRRSFVKVGLEPLKPSELPQMLHGLQAVSKAFCGLKTKKEESGEHLGLGPGELMIDAVLHCLRGVFTNIEVRVTEPTTTFSETVLQTSRTMSVTRTPNRANSMQLMTQPLKEDVFKNVDYLNNVKPSLRSEFFSDFCPEWDELMVKGLWTFGPGRGYPNALIEDLPQLEEDKQLLFGSLSPDREGVRDFLMNGFNWAVREGPLCEEPVQHCMVRLTDLDLDPDPFKWNAGQIVPTMRKATHASILLASPRLMEPIYNAEILCSDLSRPSVYTVLSRRRGKIFYEKEKPGTPFFQILAKIPVLDSFGFEVDLKCHTIGQASVRMCFDGWEMIAGDPLDPNVKVRVLEPAEAFGLAKDVMIKTRRRKGLPETVSLAKYFDEQMVLQSIKEQDIFKGIL